MAKKPTSKKSSKKSKGIVIDFTGVETGLAKHPEGRFAFAVEECELRNSESSGNDYLGFKLKSPKGTCFYIASLAPHALWNLKNFLVAAGQDVPDGEMEIDPDELVGLEVGGEVIHEKYEGKERGVISELFPVEELDGEDADDSEGEEGDDEVTYDEVQEMDKDELIELAEDNDIKLSAKIKKDVDALRELICEKLELEDEGDGKDGDSDSDELSFDDVQEMDKEELIELAEDNDIKLTAKIKKDVDLLRDYLCEKLGLEEEDGEDGEVSYEDVQGMDKDELLELAEEHDIDVPAKTKKRLGALRDLICEELDLEKK